MRNFDLIVNLRKIGTGAEKPSPFAEEERQIEALRQISRTHVELAIRLRQAQSEVELGRLDGQMQVLSEVEAQMRRQFMRLVKK